MSGWLVWWTGALQYCTHRDGYYGSAAQVLTPVIGIGHWSSIPKMELFVRSHFLVPECQSAEHRWESFQEGIET
jgi:hypothetical protein